MAAATAARARTVRTKICGITCERDALLALDLGADFLGLNFYPPSPRYLTPDSAGELVQGVRHARPAAHESARWVGVFVDPSAEHVVKVAEQARLDLVQLHGEEHADDMAELDVLSPGMLSRVIKVFRVGPVPSRSQVQEELMRRMEPWRALGVWGFLVDTLHPDLYGGTGESWDFRSVARLAADSELRLLLAGGLAPDTLGAALRSCRPWGIDLCSGVESEPGRKDPHLMRRLFEEIHHGTTRSAA